VCASFLKVITKNNLVNIKYMLFIYNSKEFWGLSWLWSYGNLYLPIQSYHHLRCECESRSGEVYLIQHYVIKFACDLWQGMLFSPGTLVTSTNKTDRHNITEILLKVGLNTTTPHRQKHSITYYQTSIPTLVQTSTRFSLLEFIQWHRSRVKTSYTFCIMKRQWNPFHIILSLKV